MSDRFETCLAAVFGEEGGFVHDKDDAGGATNLGITAATLAAAHRQGLAPHSDVTRLTREEASAIYKALYWNRAQCGRLPEPLDLLLFDAAVNCGVGTAVRFLQSALAFSTGLDIAVDGAFGPQTAGVLDALLRARAKQAEAPAEGLHADAPLRLLGLAFLAERTEHYLAISDGSHRDARRAAQEVKNRKFLRGWFSRAERLSDTLGL